MATNVTLNGVTYAIPAEGDDGWGTVLSNYFIAIASSTLQKSGGTFTLTAEANFGATYGLKSAYLKSQATNPSATGVLRLGNAELLAWRNAANSADLGLTVNSSNILQFNGSSILMPGLGSIVNADVNASAAIAYSKLNLTGTILNADLAGSIALSKLVALGTAKALQSNASTGEIEVSSVTNTELGYLSGVTSGIQTQLNAALLNPMTTGGDVIYGGASGTPTRLANGTSGQFLTSAGGTSAPSWTTPTSYYTAGAYKWDSWNPVNNSGTVTNAPATGSALTATQYMTIANSSGTVTFTLNTAGRYIATASVLFTAGNAYSFSRVIMAFGGTATLQNGANITSVGQDSVDSDHIASISFAVTATAGQTVTFLPKQELTSVNATSSFTSYANVTVQYVGATN